MAHVDKTWSPKIDEVFLERMMLASCTEISQDLYLQSPKVQMYEDIARRTVVIQMKGYLWGKTLEKFDIEYPLDWWQAVKKRFAPAWVLRRWPVKQETNQISLVAYWPTIRHLVPDHTPRLVLSVFGRSEGGYSE